jgi:hypothetical protein
MAEKTFFEKLKQKTGEVLGHPYVQQASSLGNNLLEITANLTHNKNPISVGSALLAGANVIADALNIEFTNPINFYAAKHELKVHDGQLHRLLLRSGVTTQYPLTTVLKYDTMSFVKLTFDENSSMYWIKQVAQVKSYDVYAQADEIANQYWLSPGFKSDLIHDFLWNKFKNGINLSYGNSADEQGGLDVEITDLPELGSYTELAERSAAEMVDYIKLSKSLGISRSFLLYGKPGTGKTSWTEQIAKSFGSRLVKVDSSFLEEIQNKEIEQILSLLKPEMVLFDDFDRVNFEEFEGKFLYITENLKRKYPNITFFATANNPDVIGEALLRPGRFDEKFEFACPSSQTCLHIIGSYAKDLGVALDTAEAQAVLSKHTLTPAECKEVVLRLRLRPGLKIKAIVADLKKFEDEEDGDEPSLGQAIMKKRGRPRKNPEE